MQTDQEEGLGSRHEERNKVISEEDEVEKLCLAMRARHAQRIENNCQASSARSSSLRRQTRDEQPMGSSKY